MKPKQENMGVWKMAERNTDHMDNEKERMLNVRETEREGLQREN
jgi:hypothetical protein